MTLVSDDNVGVVHTAYQQEGTKLSIWWVDDCFTNKEIKFGYLPIEHVRKGHVSTDSSGNSARIYNLLVKITKEERLNFCICSFEYFEANWHKLNSTSNILLLDIGYEGKGDNEDTYGIDLFYSLVKAEHGAIREILAKVAFLTIQPGKIEEWTLKNDIWFYNMPQPIRKAKANQLQGNPLPEKELKALISYFKESQPKEASQWALDNWRELRNKARDTHQNLIKDQVMDNDDWCHHLPCGGHPSSDSDFIATATKRLRDAISEILPAASHLPDHCWKQKQEGLPGWELPPIRALGQIDRAGKDLSVVIFLLEKAVRESLHRIELNIQYHLGKSTSPQLYPFEHDYLWFNASALARGLYELAHGFHQIVDDLICKKNNTMNDFYGLECKGRIFWKFGESFESGREGFFVEIHQDIISWHESSENNRANLTIKSYPIPPYGNNNKFDVKYYGYFKEAGVIANEIRNDQGNVTIFIPATQFKNTRGQIVWTVS